MHVVKFITHGTDVNVSKGSRKKAKADAGSLPSSQNTVRRHEISDSENGDVYSMGYDEGGLSKNNFL